MMRRDAMLFLALVCSYWPSLFGSKFQQLCLCWLQPRPMR